MIKLLTTLLDLAALLLVAVGAAAATYSLIGWSCVGVAGVVLFGGARAADYLNRPRRRGMQ